MQLHKRYIWFAALLALCYSSCRKKDQGGLSGITIEPNSGPPGNVVRVAGTGFDTNDPTQDSVFFNGVAADVISVSASAMEVIVPVTTTGTVMVEVDGHRAAGPSFTVNPVTIASLSVPGGFTGDTVVINGQGFTYTGVQTALNGQATVRFNGKQASVVSATATRLTVLVPAKPGPGPVTVSMGSETVTGPVFNYLGIDSLFPLTGNVGTTVHLTGGFGTAAAGDTVTFNGVKAVIDSASAARLVVTVPRGANTGPVAVRATGKKLTGPSFTFVPAPTIKAIAPNSGPAGTLVHITGTNFSAVPSENKVTFNGVQGTVVSVNPPSGDLYVQAPVGVTTGPVVVNVNDQVATGPVFTVQALGFGLLTQTNFVPPFQDTLKGIGFGTNPSAVTVQFNGTPVSILAISDTQMIVSIQPGITTGAVSVQVGGLTASGITYSTQNMITFAGTGTYGLVFGPGLESEFHQVFGLTLDQSSGNVYVTDRIGHNIRLITPDDVTKNFAGDPGGNSGYRNATGSNALFNFPYQITMDKGGNMYLWDLFNGVIRKITVPGAVVTTFTTPPLTPGGLATDAAGNLYVVGGDANIYEYNPSGTLASTINVPGASSLNAIAIDPQGNIYTADQNSGNLYKNTGLLYTGSGGVNMTIAVDNSGNLFIGNNSTYQLYELSAGATSMVALTGTAYAGSANGFQDGPLSTAKVAYFSQMAVDAFGIIYFTDEYNDRVRKVSLH